MDRKRLTRIVCAVLALVLLCLVCVRLWQNRKFKESAQADMNALLVQIMTCIENNDADQADRLAYGPGQLRQVFPLIAKYWPAQRSDPYEASKLTVESSLFENRQRNVLIHAVYLVHTGDEDYQVIMSYRRDDDGEGLVTLNASRIQELLDKGVIPQALGHTVDGKTFGQWCFTLLWLLCCLFSLFTVYHIFRKKPALYGLWMLLALVFFGALVYIGAKDVQLDLRIGLFSASRWTRYQNGVECFQVCLPVGALLYWSLRLRRALKRRRARRKKQRKRPEAASKSLFTALRKEKAPTGNSALSDESEAPSQPQETSEGQEPSEPSQSEHSSHRRHSSHHRHSSHRRHSSRHGDPDASPLDDSAPSEQTDAAPAPRNDYIISPRGDLPTKKRRHPSRHRNSSESTLPSAEQARNDAEPQPELTIPPLEITTTSISGEIYSPQKHFSSRRRRSSSRHRKSADKTQLEPLESPEKEPEPLPRSEPSPEPEEEFIPTSQPEPSPLPQTEASVSALEGAIYKPRKHSSRHRHSSSRHRKSSSTHRQVPAPEAEAVSQSLKDAVPSPQDDQTPAAWEESLSPTNTEPSTPPLMETTVSELEGEIYTPRTHSSHHSHSHHEHSSQQEEPDSPSEERESSKSESEHSSAHHEHSASSHHAHSSHHRHSSSSEHGHSSSSEHRHSSSSEHEHSSSSHHRHSSHRHSSSHHRHSSSEEQKES